MRTEGKIRGGRATATAGFTLLELLIATAVGAVVLLVINATFFSALRLHDATHASIDTDLTVQRTLAIVRRDLAGLMVPGNAQAASTLAGPLQTENFTSTTLEGLGGERISPDLYTSSARIDGWTSFGEVQMVSYHLTPANDARGAKNLVRVVNRNLLSTQELTGENQTLLPGVATAGISFYDGSDWTDTWDSATSNTLPTAIRFSLTLAPRENDAMRTPSAPIELIVPVLVTTTTTQQETAAAAAAGQ